MIQTIPEEKPKVATPRRRRVGPYLRQNVSPYRVLFGLLFAGVIFAAVYFYYLGDRSIRQDMTVVSKSSKEAMTTGAVKTAFSLNKQLANETINVSTVDGIVTLNGSVDSEKDKATAEEVARNTRGVVKVVNNLDAQTDDSTDMQPQTIKNPEVQKEDLKIQSAIVEALAAEQTLKGQVINVNVDNAVVTLVGKVDTQQQKELAQITAMKITGAKEVKVEGLIVNSQSDNRSSLSPK